MSGQYRKHFLPLESSPEVFTALTHRLGASQPLTFRDVLLLDHSEPFPSTTLALILILPTTAAYEAYREAQDANVERFTSRLCEAPVVWFKQTINNACGLYSVLHAICNGAAADHIPRDSVLGRLLEDCQTKMPDECARVLEDSEDIESAYEVASALGQSKAPDSAEEEVDFHYISLVWSGGRLYELDGDRKGPIDRGPCPGDTPCKNAQRVVQQYIDLDKDDIRFSLMALEQQIVSDTSVG